MQTEILKLFHPTKGPTLHHFRSSNFKAEENYLKKCWELCLEKQTPMPIKVLRIENDEGNMVVLNVGDTSRREEGCDGCLAGVTDEGQVGTERIEDRMSGSGLEAVVERSEV
jgi:hypothetical protein